MKQNRLRIEKDGKWCNSGYSYVKLRGFTQLIDSDVPFV